MVCNQIGGSIGFADPLAKRQLGYTINKIGQGLGLNEREQRLVGVMYLSLGYVFNASRSWLKAL